MRHGLLDREFLYRQISRSLKLTTWRAIRAVDVAIKGGLTSLLRTAHLADAFHMNLEIHHRGNSLNNVAHLHLM